jgi:predicted RecA/RadA family phage recombinase
MKNYVQPGEVVTVTAPRNVASGELVVVGLIAGVAATDAASGDPVEIKTGGVFDLAKTSAQAWASVGLPIYAVPGTGLCTTATTTGNVLVGTNMATAANPSATGRVRLNGVVPAAAAG